jgi:hypothetical protein
LGCTWIGKLRRAVVVQRFLYFAHGQ